MMFMGYWTSSDTNTEIEYYEDLECDCYDCQMYQMLGDYEPAELDEVQKAWIKLASESEEYWQSHGIDPNDLWPSDAVDVWVGGVEWDVAEDVMLETGRWSVQV